VSGAQAGGLLLREVPAWREAVPGRFVACPFAGTVTGHPIDAQKSQEAIA